MSFQTPITINTAINNIRDNNYLLPAIQREFIWSSNKIEWLFDSIMRNYPISSFLFWKVEGETKKGYKFYKFIHEFRERYKIHNEEISTDGEKDFVAVLDGQQRLTSLYIGLKGTYAYKGHGKWWEDSEKSLPTRRLYLNIVEGLSEQEDGRLFEFKFLRDTETDTSEIYNDKWFKVGAILNYADEDKFDDFVDEFDSKYTRKTLKALRKAIHEKLLINYFLEPEQNIDKALNIFIRINSGGEPLNFSDLMLSIAIANWKHKDARKEIYRLVDNIRDKGFSISKDFILRTFLYLYSKDTKFKVTNFSKDNAEKFEEEWDNIRNAILSVFDLVKTFGFIDSTLTSKNALLPIIYYIYHRNIYEKFHTKTSYTSDRKIIKKWLLVVTVKRLFGGTSDSFLNQIRKAFTDDINSVKINSTIESFPVKIIESKIKKDISISDEFIEDLLVTQKDDKYAFAILALLYPDLDYKNNTFHKDHLHPISSFKKKTIEALELDNETMNDYYLNRYLNNSIYNLQMLDSNENMSKNSLDLNSWVDKVTDSTTKATFLETHIIPNVDLSFSNFKEFIDKREIILKERLKSLLS